MVHSGQAIMGIGTAHVSDNTLNEILSSTYTSARIRQKYRKPAPYQHQKVKTLSPEPRWMPKRHRTAVYLGY
jgi:hypothetical protein